MAPRKKNSSIDAELDEIGFSGTSDIEPTQVAEDPSGGESGGGTVARTVSSGGGRNTADRTVGVEHISTGVDLADADEGVRVINMRLSRTSLFVPTESGDQALIIFKPLEISGFLDPVFVKHITRTRPSKRFGISHQDFWREPPKYMLDVDHLRKTGEVIPLAGREREIGNCGKDFKINLRLFRETRTIEACPYANCPHHPRPKGISHSILQAIRFISLIKDEQVINNYLQKDTRIEVSYAASLLITARRKALDEMMGNAPSSTSKVY